MAAYCAGVLLSGLSAIGPISAGQECVQFTPFWRILETLYSFALALMGATESEAVILLVIYEMMHLFGVSDRSLANRNGKY